MPRRLLALLVLLVALCYAPRCDGRTAPASSRIQPVGAPASASFAPASSASPVVVRGVRLDSVAAPRLPCADGPCALYVLDILTRSLHAVNASSYSIVTSVDVSDLVAPYDAEDSQDYAAITVDPRGHWLYLKGSVLGTSLQPLALFELPSLRRVQQWNATAYMRSFVYYTNSTEPGLVAWRTYSSDGEDPTLLQQLTNGSWYNLTFESAVLTDGSDIMSVDPAQPQLLYLAANYRPTPSALLVVYDLARQATVRVLTLPLPVSQGPQTTGLLAVAVDSASDRLYYVAAADDYDSALTLQAMQLSTNSTLGNAVNLNAPGLVVDMLWQPSAGSAPARLVVVVSERDELQSVSVDKHGGLVADSLQARTIGRYPTAFDVQAMAVDQASGDLYIASYGSMVKQVAGDSEQARGTLSVLGFLITGVAALSGGRVVIAGTGNGAALALNASTSAIVAEYPLPVDPATNGIAVDATRSLLYVADDSVHGGGASLDISSNASTVVATFQAPYKLFITGWAIDEADDGEVYAASEQCNEESAMPCVARFARNGTLLGELYDKAAITQPSGLALDTQARVLYVANSDTQLVGVVDLAGGSASVLNGTWQRLAAVVVNATGHVVVAADDALWLYPPHTRLPDASAPPSSGARQRTEQVSEKSSVSID